MFTRLRTRLAVLTTVACAAIGLAVAGGTSASAVEDGPIVPPGCVDESPGTGEVVYVCTSEEGLLRLHLGGSDYFRFEPVSGPAVTQAITTSGCAASLGGPDLVSLSPGPAGATLGQKKNSIGVRYNEGGGEPCAQVNDTGAQGQSLTFELGAAAEVDGALIDWAEIDFERKFDGVVRIDFFAGGTAGTPAGTLVLGCSPTLSDCGPDSTDGDNFRLDTANPPDGQASPAPFDTMVMSLDSSGASNGAFSLEGGADGTAPGPVGATLAVDPTDSIFHIISQETLEFGGTLDCGDSTTVVVPSEPTGPSTSSTANRLSVNKVGSCEVVPFNHTAAYVTATGEQTVAFEPFLLGQEGAEFEWIIQWDQEEAVYPLTTTTQIDFGDGLGRDDLEWCGGTYNPAGATPDARMASVVPVAGLGGCLASQTVVIVNGELEITEVLLLSEDPRAWR